MGWILGLLALASSAGSAVFLFQGQYQFAATAHLLSVLCGARGSMWLRGESAGGGQFEYGVGLAVPCAGGAIVWLHAALEGVTECGGAAKKYTEYIDPITRLGEAKLPDVRRNPGPSPEALEPLASVLTSDASVDEKRNAVARLARLETPQAVQALRGALQSDSREIRFLAANAISSLEQRLNQRLGARRRDGGEPEEVSSEEALETAQAYYDYAYYGLAEHLDKDTYLAQALEYVQSAWEEGHDPDALLLWGRILLQVGDSEAAVEMFDRYLTCESRDARGYLWRAEANYKEGNYRAVRSDCTRAKELGYVPEVTRGAVEMWAAELDTTEESEGKTIELLDAG